ncbi:MAG: hypothetical protein P4L22_05415 [Candidatus Babeliales bacterium]|nr:hypothetical protein [Candidatus Babeliales bacterium]
MKFKFLTILFALAFLSSSIKAEINYKAYLAAGVTAFSIYKTLIEIDNYSEANAALKKTGFPEAFLKGLPNYNKKHKSYNKALTFGFLSAFSGFTTYKLLKS